MPEGAEELLLDERRSTASLAEHFGVHHSVITRWKSEAAALPDPAETQLREAIEELTFENGIWSALENVQEQYKTITHIPTEVSLTLPDEKPVLVVFQSDQHIGHIETRMAKMREDLETIKKTEGLYVILGGDLFDNVVSGVAGRGMHNEQLTPIEIQQHLADEFVSYLGAKNILAMLLGNHEAWSIRGADFNPVKYLARSVGCPYLGDWGFVNLTVGQQDYRILAAHQFRMASGFNKTHSAKRMSDFVGDADVVFTGHRHAIATEMTEVRNQARFFAQAGTYLRTSRYGRMLGHDDSSVEMPGCILYPDRRKIIPLYDALTDGPWMLAAARQGY